MFKRALHTSVEKLIKNLQVTLAYTLNLAISKSHNDN